VKDSRATQRGRILELLIAARGDWVLLPKITDCAAQYNARIFELRRLGFRIKNRTQVVNGARHSWFRLEPRPATATSPQERQPVTPTTEQPDRIAKAREWLSVAHGESMPTLPQLQEPLPSASTPSFPQFGALVKESYGVD
jgi:hypothetical protein